MWSRSGREEVGSKTSGRKQRSYPHNPLVRIMDLFACKDRDVFAFAGLWEKWVSKTDGEVTQPLHNRMPVILSQTVY